MIDWGFIAAREGGQVLTGYVPDAGSSGVTIATGIDLGYFGTADLATLEEPLKDKLLPYLGLIGDKARKALAAHPLSVSKQEADAIEAPKRRALITALSTHYLRSSAHPFEQLPDAAQTVMASVTWQYGTPWARCPNWWKACCARDWPSVIHELRNFGDDYSSRRELEADYLERGLSAA